MKIGLDKWKHFYVGMLLGAVLQVALGYLLGPSSLTAIFSSLALLVIICYGFEIFSLVTGLGHYEWADAVSGIVGGIIGLVLATTIRT